MKRETDWGLPIEPVYTPDDIKDVDYTQNLGDPGNYPYTRGFYSQGYRTRQYTRRQVAGFGTPSETNKILKFAFASGQIGGINIIADRPGYIPIDYDHPMAKAEAGKVGVAISSLDDLEQILEGIPIENQSITFSNWGIPGVFSVVQFLALCEKRRIDSNKIRGGAGGNPLSSAWGCDELHPLEMGLKLIVDLIEYVSRQKIKMRWLLQGLTAREGGQNMAYELAISFATYREVFDKLIERGLAFDDFAVSIATPLDCGHRFFEEVAKVRAQRRMWAKMAKERYGAKNESSYKLVLPVKTAGSALVYQQPLNNIVRGTIACLAAVIGGCTAVDMSTYDEPLCEPTEQAIRLALSTQAIVNYETGATDTVDPMGGSYYVEYLTNKLEEEAKRIWDEIESNGGMKASLENGWIMDKRRQAIYENQKAIENKDRIYIGINEMVIPPEEEDPVPIRESHPESAEKILKIAEEFKKSRDNEMVKKALQKVYEDAQRGEKFNLMPSMIAASMSHATAAETMGVIRMANGLSYDPFNMIEAPFSFG